MELLFIGFAAGFAHVISGADHLAALAPFAARREQHAAWRLGLHWGLGHAGGVALIGLLVWLLKGTAAVEWLSSGAEQLGGVMLVAVGALGIRSLLRHRVHTHEHDHFGIRHSHIHTHLGQAHSPASHKHSHAALGIGLLHGTAASPPSPPAASGETSKRARFPRASVARRSPALPCRRCSAAPPADTRSAPGGRPQAPAGP